MRPANIAWHTSAEPSEPQPWRTAEDAKGWRVVGVGKRHPRWLEFEIAAIAARHEPIGPAANGPTPDHYRPAARTIAERLRAMDPASTAAEELFRLTREAFSAIVSGRPPGNDATYRAMADEILAAWRAHAARMADAPIA